MTPEQRLDQVEIILAETSQKVDRLIELNGQLIETSLRAESKADITAKGIAELTKEVRSGFKETNQQLSDLKASQETIINLLKDKLK